jgi:dihydropyrimidinase/allantoinase
VDSAENQALVDYAFYGAAGEDNLDNIWSLAERGVIGFKTFLHGPPPGREKEFIGLHAKNSASLLQVFQKISHTGLTAAIHAEDDSLLSLFNSKTPVMTLKDWARCRPPIVEIEAIARALIIARETNVRLAVCHVSTPKAVEIIDIAKRFGQEVYAETCLHYLLNNYETAAACGPFAKMKPPLRNKEDSKRLLLMYKEGRIDYIGSDHAPFTEEEKLNSTKDNNGLVSAPEGIAAMELTLPLLLARVKSGQLGIEDIVRTCCKNPAKVFGLFPRKGTIQPGSDADLVLVDLERTSRVDTSKLKTKAKACAKIYEDWQIGNGIILTMVRGKVVMKNGEITGTPGWGEWLCPKKN